MRRKSWFLSLYFAVILVLSLLLSLSFNSGACLADNWTQTAGHGFEANFNSTQLNITSSAMFGSLLYQGTEDTGNGCQIWSFNGSSWSMVVSGGFNDMGNATAQSMCEYNSKLYVGTGKLAGGCEVWSFDGSSWTQVNSDGFNSQNNTSARSMAVYGGSLYIGTKNVNSGGEVWKYNGSSWNPVATGGFGDTDNFMVSSLCVYGSDLFAGTTNYVDGCDAWKYNGSSWTQSVGGSTGMAAGFGGGYENLGIASMTVLNSKLYAGLQVNWDSNIWIFPLVLPKPWARKVWSFDGTTWTAMTMNGGYCGPNTGNGTINDSAVSMVVYNSELCIGTDNRPASCMVWRFDAGLSKWERLSPTYGFGVPANESVPTLAVSGSNLYAGTKNIQTGAEAWKYDGANWTNINRAGFAPNNNYRAAPMLLWGSNLYAGTNNSAGAQLWKNTGGGWTKAGEKGFGNPTNVGVSSLATFNSKLYIGTRNTTDGGEVYSYNGSTFVQVNNSGFHSTAGQKNPLNCDVPSMVVFNGSLFAGTHNLKDPTKSNPGCEIYRYNGTTWTNDRTGGFGDDNNKLATSMCVYNNNLYVGVQNLTTGCQIWKRNTAGTWVAVESGGFGSKTNNTASAMIVHGGYLYVGVSGTAARIWKYDGSAWSPVGQDGANKLGEQGNLGVASMTDFGGVLYAGTDNGNGGTGCQVWRSTDDGANWSKAASGGFGNTNNAVASSLAVFNSKIFAGTLNDNDGCEIWSSLGLPGSIQSVTPGVGRHGQTRDVTVVGNGTHFVNGVSEAQFSGKGIKVNSTTVSGQTATANITVAADAGVGTRDVNVITDQDTPTALQGSFTVLSPKITGVSPSSVNQGQTRDVVITGADTDFINWSNQAELSNPDITVLSTTPVDATHLQAKIEVGHDAMPGDWDVGVKVNTDGIVVDPLKDGLTVKAAPPRLDSVSPHYGAIGDTVTLKGDWFGPQKLSSKVAFNGVTANVTAWSEKKIVCEVPAGAGMVNVVVTTDAGSSWVKPFNIVNTKVGTNVKVNLGGGASVVFDQVTTAGNTQGPVVQEPLVDPYSPIKNGTLDITTTAGYSGNVTVTMSYAGYQLLDYQEAAITMLHEEGDGWRDITLSRDTQEKTVTGQASGLSRFTLQIAPASAPATATWYLAEGSTDYGFDCYITIENPNDSAVTANVTYMTGEGPVDGGVVSLPAKSQATINPRDTLGNKDFSTKVVCNEAQIIAVDRTMTWTGPGAASPEAHNSIGVTGSNTTWYLPEGSSKWGFECYLLIQNPNATDANCDVTYMIEGEAPQTFTKQVPANSRKTFNMADDIGEKDASIKVGSDQPVIPERAMYRNNRREGHDSIGTTEPANNYYLAEGSSAWGFTTYVLVQNPNEEATDVTLTYMTTEGPKTQPTFTMPAKSRKTIRVNDSLPDKDFSTMVSGSKPIVAERAMYWDNGTGEATHDSIGESGPHKTFYMPDGDTRIDWQTWTLVQNPNNSDVEVEISYLTATGAGNIVFTETIPANSRRTFSMGDKIMNQRAAILVRCMTPDKTIMVERAMYFNNKGLGTSTIGGYSD